VLSNLYLNPLDHQMADAGFEMVRYADDSVVLCRSQSEAEEALKMISAWVEPAGQPLPSGQSPIGAAQGRREVEMAKQTECR